MTEIAERAGIVSPPRIGIFSNRNLTQHLARCGIYEFEDLINEFDHADILSPTPGRTYWARDKLRGVLSRKTSFHRVIAPGAKNDLPKVQNDYDLFIVWALHLRDLLFLDAVPNWRTRSKQSVCYIQELWCAEIPGLGARLRLFDDFDHIYCNFYETAHQLSKVLGRPVKHMPVGIDAIRFSPYPHCPPRHIDVCGIGRRSKVTHEALFEQSDQLGLYYHFDSTKAVKWEAICTRQHRRLLSDIIKRSRYFICNRAKVDAFEETAGQDELAVRFFEGMAGGAILIGERPRCIDFDLHFGWEDAVFDIPFDCPDILDTILELDKDPGRLEQIRKNNLTQIAMRHDWLYRWRTILQDVGLSETDAMRKRQKKLMNLVRQMQGEESQVLYA